MTLPAIICFSSSAAILWGGLAWSLLRLRRYPDVSEVRAEDPELL